MFVLCVFFLFSTIYHISALKYCPRKLFTHVQCNFIYCFNGFTISVWWILPSHSAAATDFSLYTALIFALLTFFSYKNRWHTLIHTNAYNPFLILVAIPRVTQVKRLFVILVLALSLLHTCCVCCSACLRNEWIYCSTRSTHMCYSP